MEEYMNNPPTEEDLEVMKCFTKELSSCSFSKPRSPFKPYVDSIRSIYVTAYGPGLTHGITGEPCHFIISVSAKGITKGGLQMTVNGPSKPDVSFQDNKDGTVAVSYLPTAPGEYNITLKFGEKYIKGSPYVVKITDYGNQHADEIENFNYFTDDMPCKLVRNFKKPRREQRNPFKASPLTPRPATPGSTKEIYSLLPTKDLTEAIESSSQGKNIDQLNMHKTNPFIASPIPSSEVTPSKKEVFSMLPTQDAAKTIESSSHGENIEQSNMNKTNPFIASPHPYSEVTPSKKEVYSIIPTQDISKTIEYSSHGENIEQLNMHKTNPFIASPLPSSEVTPSKKEVFSMLPTQDVARAIESSSHVKNIEQSNMNKTNPFIASPCLSSEVTPSKKEVYSILPTQDISKAMESSSHGENMEQLNMHKTNPFISIPLHSSQVTPSKKEVYSLLPTQDVEEAFESSSQGKNIRETNIKEALQPLEISKPLAKSNLLLRDPLEFPSPPKILNAFDARAQVEDLIKPTPVVLSLSKIFEKDLQQEQEKVLNHIQLCNSKCMRDIKRNEQPLMERGVSHGSSTVIDKHLLEPPTIPNMVISSPRDQVDEDMLEVTNLSFDENNSKIEVKTPELLDIETFSLAFNASKAFVLEKPEPTMKEPKMYNYVKMATQQTIEDTFDEETKPIIMKIPSNDIITMKKMQVTKFGVFQCVDRLFNVLKVFEDKKLLSQSEQTCKTSQYNVEENIKVCIKTLLSFSDLYEQDELQLRANKGNTFGDAKEKNSATFDIEKYETRNQKLSENLESDLKNSLSVTMPEHIENKSKCPNHKLLKKNVSTQVKCTANVKDKSIPIPKIVVTKPKCPSPYPSHKFNGKDNGGDEYCGINDTQPNTDSTTLIKEEENTTTDTQTLFPQGEVITESADSRFNKTCLRTFSHKVLKQEKTFIKIPKINIELKDDSCSPYELPKSMIPLGTTPSNRERLIREESFSTSNLSNDYLTIPSGGKVDMDIDHSISMVTDEIVFTDFTKQNGCRAKQRANQISPMYWITKNIGTDEKASPFRTLLKKVTKPFQKSHNVERKNILAKSFEKKTGIINNTENDEIKAFDTELLGKTSSKELIPPPGKILKVPSADECRRRNRNFQAWLDAQNDQLWLAKQSQSNREKKVGFEEHIV